MTVRLHVVDEPPGDLDLTEADPGDPALKKARRVVSDAVPVRAWCKSSSRINSEFRHTNALCSLVSWHAQHETRNPDGDSEIAVLAGPPGTGKTTAVAWLAINRLVNDVQSGTEFHWYTAPELARTKRTGVERDALIQSMSQIVVIDDLGAEHVSGSRADDWRADFDELIDAVYRSTCGIALITTNLNAQRFRRRYGSRIVDRLRECGTWIPIEGPSMRGERKP